MKLDKSKIKLFSSVGSRATFGLVCLELAKEFENLMAVERKNKNNTEA